MSDQLKKYFCNDVCKIILGLLDRVTYKYVTGQASDLSFYEKFQFILLGDYKLLRKTRFPSSLKQNKLLKPLLNSLDDKLTKAILKKLKMDKPKRPANPSTNGFLKPCLISDEMCDFLNIPHGTFKSRVDVTRGVNAYIKENNLQNPVDKRRILPDDTLIRILNLTITQPLTYFNLQTHLTQHFPRVPIA